MKRFLPFLFLISCGTMREDLPPKKEVQSINLPEVKIDGSLSRQHQEEKPKLTREELLSPLFQTLDLFCEEKEIFDEPRGEGPGIQQDGMLRSKWFKAYMSGKHFFKFIQEDSGYIGNYSVYGKKNTPLPPMVCPDLITDTLERTSGTWYRADPKNPGRDIGILEIRDHAKEEGFDVRRIFELIAYMKTHPENFEFVFEGIGPKVGRVKELRSWMKDRGVSVGDIVVVSGKAPWDLSGISHQHSMFVRELDSSGMVKFIVGNSDWVQKRSLAIEVSRAPKRRVIAVIRLTDQFLEGLRK